MPTQLLFLACASLVTVVDRPLPRARHANDRLEGSWVLAAVREGDGKDLRMEHLQDPMRRWLQGLRLTFADGRVLVRTAADPNPKRLTFKVRPTKRPPEIDFSPGLTPTNEAIYRVKGDTLTLAFSLGWELVSGGTYRERQYQVGRPRDFRQTKDRAAPIILILKRVRP
jgi:uncharacterized protein (TIGR03067 family)